MTDEEKIKIGLEEITSVPEVGTIRPIPAHSKLGEDHNGRTATIVKSNQWFHIVQCNIILKSGVRCDFSRRYNTKLV